MATALLKLYCPILSPRPYSISSPRIKAHLPLRFLSCLLLKSSKKRPSLPPPSSRVVCFSTDSGRTEAYGEDGRELTPELHLYNTMSRRKEPFRPLVPGKVGMYVCGVTPYDLSHIGHARVYVTFDVLFRYLQHLNYEVCYVRNFTDVDDKDS